MTDETKINSANDYLLPVSILLAAIIFSGSLLMAANSLSTSLTSVNFGSAIQAAPSAQAPSLAPTPNAPPVGTIKLSAAMKDAAATRGDPNAKVVVIEYSDYQCPFCRAFFENSGAQLKSDYVDSGKVLFVYKDFPLSFHPGAPFFALAARCAGDQSKYWEMHDKIFQEQAKGGQGTITFAGADALKQWAKDIGLDETSFNSCFDSGKYNSVIQSNESNGIAVGVGGTPSFYIGKKDGTGTLLVGAQPFSSFKSAIDSLLQ